MTTLEIAENAKDNFANCTRAVASLKDNPLWQIAMSQLDEVIRRLEKMDE